MAEKTVDAVKSVSHLLCCAEEESTSELFLHDQSLFKTLVVDQSLKTLTQHTYIRYVMTMVIGGMM